jgi:hypothetical protein
VATVKLLLLPVKCSHIPAKKNGSPWSIPFAERQVHLAARTGQETNRAALALKGFGETNSGKVDNVEVTGDEVT